MKVLGRNIELLSPAGTYESLNAAINAGADSIYFGAGKLNMRARSSFNFSLNDIKEVVKICRDNNIKAYLTLNTVIYDEEIEEVKKILKIAKSAGISAIIASDLCVIKLAYKEGLSVHISVQANVSNIESLKFYAQYADVVVLARELNLNQIKKIKDHIDGKIDSTPVCGPGGNPIRLEIFVHGALCVSISGKCYMSLFKYNSSANRGACFQNCRRKYRLIDESDGSEVIVDNQYVMSPKDICLIRVLDEIVKSGVEIFKIEGRGRSADYVHTVTKVYKEALESINKDQYTEAKKDKWEEKLKTVFNRGFWHGGYYLGRSSDMWSGKTDNQATLQKTRVGIVKNYYTKISVAEIHLKEYTLSLEDKIMIVGPTTGVKKANVSEIRLDNRKVNKANKGEIITVPFSSKVRRNDEVYILKNKK